MLKIKLLIFVAFVTLVSGCSDNLLKSAGLVVSIVGEKLDVSAGSVDLVSYQR